MASPAAANCKVDSACDASRIAASMSNYRGPLAATTQDMVCIHAVAYEPTALVLADGDQPLGAPVQGEPLTRWRVQRDQWSPWETDPQYVQREICFPRAFLKDGNNPRAGFREALTLCNGEYLDEPLRNRSVFRKSKGVPQFIWSERRVEANDPACLLGSETCARYGL